LRTNFAAIEGSPRQVIRAAGSFDLPHVDMRGARSGDLEIQALMEAEARRRFDLASEPLFRAIVIHCADGRKALLCTMHHIVSDGWSIDILTRELTGLYEAFSGGQASPFEELPIQYVDFVGWQQSWLKGEVLERHLDYWKEKLGDSRGFSLEADLPRPDVPTYQSRQHYLSIPPEVSDSLKNLSRGEKVTMFMTLLAAFQTLLYRCSDQEDIVVGTAIANRNRAEVESLIGFFVNLLPLKTDLAGNPTFAQLLARVREVALEAYAHQDLPFEQMVQALRPDRDAGSNPLVQTVLLYRSASAAAPVGRAAAGIEVIQIDKGTSPFELLFSISEVESGLLVAVSYAADLFTEETIERLASRFTLLLEAVSIDPSRHISDIPLAKHDDADSLELSRLSRIKLSRKDLENLLEQVSEA
jgi:hypothetical protein